MRSYQSIYVPNNIAILWFVSKNVPPAVVVLDDVYDVR